MGRSQGTRRAIGIELKESYFNIAVRNLTDAERESQEVDLFAFAGVQIDRAVPSPTEYDD